MSYKFTEWLTDNDLPAWFWGVTSLAFVLLVGVVDYLTGYLMEFYVYYFLPVATAAWFLGFSGAVFISVLSTVVGFCVDYLTGHGYGSTYRIIWDIMDHLAGYLIIGACFSQLATLVQRGRESLVRERALLYREQQLSEELRKSLSEIKILEAFLPICAVCKKIRDDKGRWHTLETYISNRTATKFSHGYCQDCADRIMTDVAKSGDPVEG